MRRSHYDAVVVGSGPNGLAAAVEIAQHGRSVLVVEGSDRIGGGTRTEPLTIDGYLHDVCSAVHPLGIGSPYLRTLPLEHYGLIWDQPEVPLSHPFDNGTAAALYRSIDETAENLGPDGRSYVRLMAPLVARADDLFDGALRPLVGVPRHPLLLARFGLSAVLPATLLVRRFRTEAPRGLFAGLAGHSVMPLDRPFTSAVGMMLAVAAHAHGWPIARGGSQAIATALTGYLAHLGGEVVTGTEVTSLDDLPAAQAVILDVMPGAAARIAGDRISPRRRSRFARWRHGPGAYKVDWALRGPVPWRDPVSPKAGTVHLGATMGEIASAEASTWRGEQPPRPLVLLSQPTVIDPTRAPAGGHIAWGYCHVPAGWDGDAADLIEAQVERFAPGFRDLVIARHTMGPADFEVHNPNYVGGDITGGVITARQLVGRPTFSLDPYRLGAGIYLCSSSTPPGAGVHGMCGYHAARSALRHELR